MVSEAEERGADAVISMRFDADSISDGWTEICAYGTAVRTQVVGGAQAEQEIFERLKGDLAARAARIGAAVVLRQEEPAATEPLFSANP